MATKKSSDLTLKDKLSRLRYRGACALLGARGAELIRRGGAAYAIDVAADVSLGANRFELRLPRAGGRGGEARVTITLADDARRRLCWRCSACDGACEHVGAALSLVLEEKLVLGLAAPPPERVPAEALSDEQLIARALEERSERARSEKMTLRAAKPGTLWSDYTITSAESGKTYRLALRGAERGESYCSCPDFRKNTLGTCKHILHALAKLKRRFPARAWRRRHRRKGISVHLRYGVDTELRLLAPARLDDGVRRIIGPLLDRPIDDVRQLVKRIGRLERTGHTVMIYPDAEEWIQQRLFAARVADDCAAIRRDPAGHPLRTELLDAELLPYQLDGIAFAVGAGRAILADDMGLGKTIQGIGVAELLARAAGIRKVLVICPASLKSQWRDEIQRFCGRSSQLVVGRADERAHQYDSDAFFTVCNYEQVLRDIQPIERVAWDLIVLDEGQRIKNWEAKTSAVVKGLRSPFALVLSGTPLENRLDDLFSIAEFIDDRRLGPAFRFFHRHRVVDERGKVLGYDNLGQLREMLRPILLRRTRDSVMRELPERTTQFVRIAPTAEQRDLHDAHMQTVASIVRKPYISEMDLLRLQKALLMCRMAADSTVLVDKQRPGYSSKLEALDELLDKLLAERGRKIVLFSEWTTMLDLIEQPLRERGARYVRLDGSVPQKKRQQLVHDFQRDPDCQLFLTSNAGSTGLNLQAANTVINVDLPWNLAVLEQRVARAHRMGQKRPVHVYVMVTEGTIEENMLATLSAKHELALAALDADSDVDSVDLATGIDELKRRLEVLIGAKPEAPVDESARRAAEHLAQQDRIAAAGGQLLTAAFDFLGEVLPPASPSREVEAEQAQVASALRAQLARCVQPDAAGRLELKVTLPGAAALDSLAGAMARLLAAGPPTAPPGGPRT